MRDNADNKIAAKNARRSTQPMRSAGIALGVVVFLFAFRPFGLEIESLVDALVLLGLAPLNFLIMLGLHVLSLRLIDSA